VDGIGVARGIQGPGEPAVPGDREMGVAYHGGMTTSLAGAGVRALRVSVLLPCRNAAPFLDEALASLAAQTYRDFEIVAVDDGSTDDTAAVLGAWSRRGIGVRVLRTGPRGIVEALNAAAAAARGALLARMDADDVAEPERLARQVAWMEAHPEAAACGTLVRYFPRECLRDGARRYESWVNAVVTAGEIARDLFVECPIPHPTLMMRRTDLEALGGYRDEGWPEDYDLILRLAGAGRPLGKVADVLLHWRDRPDRLSRTAVRYRAEAFRRCKVHYLDVRLRGRPAVVWGAGPIGKAFARALRARGGTVAAFVDIDPRKVGQRVHGVPVIAPDAIGAYRACYVLAAVGQTDAREQIRAALRAAGWEEGRQFCAVA
jgi:glycosyltransferase involved in cell wall biosynthesis